jgi:hypothetical protein
MFASHPELVVLTLVIGLVAAAALAAVVEMVRRPLELDGRPVRRRRGPHPRHLAHHRP